MDQDRIVDQGRIMDQGRIQLRMAIANLWMMATGNKFVNITMPWQQQVEDIELRLKEQSRLPWHAVLDLFNAQHITWSTAFEMLMSRCGFSMENALICLAEHFDRRKIEIEEISDNTSSPDKTY